MGMCDRIQFCVTLLGVLGVLILLGVAARTDELSINVYGVSEGSISVAAEGCLSGQLNRRGRAQPYLRVRTSAGGLRDLTAGERQQIGEPGAEIYDCEMGKVTGLN